MNEEKNQSSSEYSSNETLADIEIDNAQSALSKMPRWVPYAIAIFFLFQLLFNFVSDALNSLSSFFVIIVVSLFLSFAIEPAVNMLAICILSISYRFIFIRNCFISS